MQFDLTDDQRAFRDGLRSWLVDNVPTGFDPPGTPTGFAQHLGWEKQLVAAGYGAIHWPVEYGGRGAGPVEQAIFEEEYLTAGGPERVTVIGHNLFGPTLIRWGSDEQKARWLPGVLSAEVMWSQGYSEPEAGSDLAGVRTTAVLDGDSWVVNGQKIWTSYGAYADWIFALVRTNPDVAKHAGLSFLALPLDTPGVEVRPIAQLDGHAGFAEVFFTDARVPVENVIGGVDNGWAVAGTALEFERDAPAAAPARYQRDLRELADIVRAVGLADDAVVRDTIGRLAVAVDAYEHHAERTLATLVAGSDLGPLSSLTKLAWSELERDLYTTGRELLGTAGELLDELPGVADAEGWRTRYWYARAATIYAGTSEIQRNIISQRVLGLPRRPDADARDALVPPVDVRFTDEQVALRDAARALFATANPPQRLRELFEGKERGDDVWHRVAAMGLPAIPVPEDVDGMGGDARDTVLVLEEAGRSALPEPLADTLVAAGILADVRNEVDVEDWLRRIAAGEATIGVQLDAATVHDADRHAAILVTHDDALWLASTATATIEVLRGEDQARRPCRVTHDLAGATRLGGADVVARAEDLAAAATAAELVGVCTHLLDEAVAYAKVRRQFATPIGAFQAVAHELADMFVVLESARGAARHAARRHAVGGPDAGRAARVAKAAANDAARRIETQTLQVFGGIGFTWEHDLHLWLKRALALQSRHGTTRTLRAALAADVLTSTAE